MVNDPVLVALDDLREALARNVEVGQTILARIDELTDRRTAGASWTEVTMSEERPLIVEQLSANLDRLSTAGSRLRRSQAKALHDEGMTMEQVAQFFGVTRQRISALLKSGSATVQGEPAVAVGEPAGTQEPGQR